jgi:hypothetical protein
MAAAGKFKGSNFTMALAVPSDDVPVRAVAHRLLSYEVGMIGDQVVLTLRYAAADATSGVKQQVLRVALPAEGAMRTAMGLLEVARELAFEESTAAPSPKH